MTSLESILHSSSRALVIGVGGGGDVVGGLAAVRFLEFCGIDCVLGGLSWEQPRVDPQPGPRSLEEVVNVKPLHRRVWLANRETRTIGGVRFAESRMAEILDQEILLLDINGGVGGIVEGIVVAARELKVDLLVGVDVGGDSLASGNEPGLRSPLADAVMLAAFVRLSELGHSTLWAMFGYGSDGELSTDELDRALSAVAREGGFLGGWALTQSVVAELREVIERIPTEASAIPVHCAMGAFGNTEMRRGGVVKLTTLSTITFYLSPSVVFGCLSRPAQAVIASRCLEEANNCLHALGLVTELDFERGLDY